MPRRSRIKLFDASAKNVLRRIDEVEALTMVDAGIAFKLSDSPLELALSTSPPTRNQVDIERLRPDRSLTVGPSVIRGAAAGFGSNREIVEAYSGSIYQENLRALRVKAGLSLERVALRLNRTRSWLSKVELRQIPLRKEKVDEIARILAQLS